MALYPEVYGQHNDLVWFLKVTQSWRKREVKMDQKGIRKRVGVNNVKMYWMKFSKNKTIFKKEETREKVGEGREGVGMGRAMSYVK